MPADHLMTTHTHEPGKSLRAAAGRPEQVLSVIGAIGLTVGIVIGSGIFRAPSIVAGNASSTTIVVLAWVLGGVVSLIGALVYAELATTYPHAGGDYHYITRAFGQRIGFLLAWARLAVIQTGSVALVSFVFGDYMSQVWSLGPYSASIYAGALVVALTALNAAGVREGTSVQNVLTTVEVLGVVLVIVAGFSVSAPAVAAAPASAAPAASSFGLMMVFVLLTYGGWNEAAYLSAEVRDVRRNMVRALAISLLLITALYVLANLAYLNALGLAGTASSNHVATDVMRLAYGDRGAVLISVLVAVSAMTTANATVFTGARTSYALGSDVMHFGFLGHWNARTGTPVNALVVQGVVALALVALGTLTRGGFETMVDYTAPVFWFFFLLTGVAFFVLRRREPQIARPFRVPFYPLTPAIFCGTCAYLLYSSLAYTGTGALVGVAVLAVGALILAIQPKRT
jgi:APA family basic amino acid/polyamine antiporter